LPRPDATWEPESARDERIDLMWRLLVNQPLAAPLTRPLITARTIVSDINIA
jgi:hypothetical protein